MNEGSLCSRDAAAPLGGFNSLPTSYSFDRKAKADEHSNRPRGTPSNCAGR